MMTKQASSGGEVADVVADKAWEDAILAFAWVPVFIPWKRGCSSRCCSVRAWAHLRMDDFCCGQVLNELTVSRILPKPVRSAELPARLRGARRRLLADPKNPIPRNPKPMKLRPSPPPPACCWPWRPPTRKTRRPPPRSTPKCRRRWSRRNPRSNIVQGGWVMLPIGACSVLATHVSHRWHHSGDQPEASFCPRRHVDGPYRQNLFREVADYPEAYAAIARRTHLPFTYDRRVAVGQISGDRQDVPSRKAILAEMARENSQHADLTSAICRSSACVLP